MAERRRAAAAAVASALPWLWFPLRESTALLEWVAVLLPLLVGLACLGLLVLTPWTRRALGTRGLLFVSAAWLCFGVVAVVGPWTPQRWPAPAPEMTFLTANVLGENDEPLRAAEDLIAVQADVVVLQEVMPHRHHKLLTAMDAAYPYRLAPVAGVGVWSHHELHASAPPSGELPEAARGRRVVVRGPAGDFALYGLHLYRPAGGAYKTGVTVQQQRELVAELDRVVDADLLPAVIAGDLNLTDRGAAYRMLADGRRDAQRADWAAPTGFRSRNRPLLLRIDHVLMPESWCSADSRRVSVTGSDHRAVAVSIGPCP